jgi:hypothetical protein
MLARERGIYSMLEIVLTDEQAKVVATALKPVQVRDNKGHLLGVINPIWTEEDIAEAKRRAASPGPRYTGEQVQRRLQALQEEWDRTGGFDQDYMNAFLERLNVADPGHMRSPR